MSSAESATQPDAKSDLSPDDPTENGEVVQQEKSSSARRRARRRKSRRGQTRHDRGRAWKEVAKVLRRTRKTYLGKDRPWKIGWWCKFFSALLGIAAFVTAGVSKILRTEVERTSDLVTNLVQLLTDLDNARETTNKLATLDFELFFSRLEFLGIVDEILPWVYGLLSFALAAVIASGIKHGGPLRLFFLGAAVPGLVIFTANRIFQ